MKKYFQILRQCALFWEMKDGEIEEMLACLGARVSAYGKKDTVIGEGEPVQNIGIVLSGRLQVVQVDYFGNRSIVGNLEASDLFGESFACAGVTAMPVNVICGEDSEVMLIDHRRIMYPCSNVCGFHRKLIDNLLKVVAMKNLAFHQKLEIISKRTTREKLMAFLLLQAKIRSSSSFEIPYDRQELADFLGVDRSGLSAEIGKLRKEGILESERNQFKLL